MGARADCKRGYRRREPAAGAPLRVNAMSRVAGLVAAFLASGCGGGSGSSSSQSAPAGPDLPGISVSDSSRAEGDTGTASMVFALSLSQASGESVTVGYSTVDESATAGDDYSPVSGILGFAPGEITAEISVQVVGDANVETDESLGIVLSNPQNAVIVQGMASGFIINDDLRSRSGSTPGPATRPVPRRNAVRQ